MNRAEIRANLDRPPGIPQRHAGGALHLPPPKSQGRRGLRLREPSGGWAMHPGARATPTARGSEQIIAGEPTPGGYYILGAHFDTVAGTPGADDNASGVAVLLEVARLAREPTRRPGPGPSSASPARSPRPFPPPTWAPGFTPSRPGNKATKSWACSAWRWWAITRRSPDSQELPLPLRLLGYPTTGNFLGLVSDRRSRRCSGAWRPPSRAAAACPPSPWPCPWGATCPARGAG